MADDWNSARYQTQRLEKGDITQHIEALETPLKGNEEEKNQPTASGSNPFARIHSVEQDDIEADKPRPGCTMDDLLNGYVVNEEALSAIDECLIYIRQEWDLSDILSKDISDVQKLISTKSKDATNTLLSAIIDPPNVIYDTLLRIARKIMAISLVINNEKMIYVPNNIEELEEIGTKLNELSSIITIRTDKRTRHKEVDIADDDLKGDYKELEAERSPSPPALGADRGQDLEALVFGNRQLYKDSAICKRREKEYLDKKKGGKYSSMQIKSGTSKENNTMPIKSEGGGQTDLMNIEEQINNNEEEAPLTPSDKNADDDDIVKQEVDDGDTPKPTGGDTSIELPEMDRMESSDKSLKKAHSGLKIRCAGCGNLIDFTVDYDSTICYQVPIMKDQYFYFHDSFCVTLRRLKESIRRFVLDQSLPEARRAETTVGYVRNLLANFNTLITVGGVLPRPNPLISAEGGGITGGLMGSKKRDIMAERIENMSFIRSNAHKLMLRQQALEGREAKNFDDEYEWKFKDIPQSVQYADVVIYGPCLAKFVIQQLLSKQLESLWLTLAYVASGLPATKSLEIVEEHRTDLAKVKEMEHLDLVLTSMIEAADYTIAMSLYLSAYMMENAERDLSRSEDFQEVADKYIRIASQLMASVESDHLLSLLLECPTDIAHLSVFEIAIKYGIDDFMDDSRIQMLMAHMWSEFDFLDPQKNFRTQDISLFELLDRLVKTPARFYYCPVGRYWTESVMYMVYIIVVTIVVYEANYELDSALSAAEWTMWIFNIGFVAGEITQMLFEGIGYLTDVGNSFDVLLMINWALIGMIRFGCKSVFHGSDTCEASNNYDTVEDGQSRNSTGVLMYTTLFCLQMIILWSRVTLIFATSRAVGPFISMVPGMIRDIVKWAFVLGIFFIGFCFGTQFIIAGDIGERCAEDLDASLENFSLVVVYNFILLQGQSEWSILEANDCVSRERSLVIKLYMFAFAIMGTILLLNLLIAMMASTYEQIREGTAKQVNFARAEQTFSLSHRNAIIPPPLNVLVYAFSVVWFTFEFLVWLCSGGKYILNIEKLVPIFIDYDEEFEQFDNKNERNLDKTPLLCCRSFQRLKDPTGLLKEKIAKRYSETARYCQFCRCYMRINGNISHYFKLFVNYRLDEADVKFMKSLMQNAGICPQCYRPFRIYENTATGMKTNRLYRWQVILELLSFYVFMLVIWFPLIFLITIPGLIGALIDKVEDVKSNTKIVGGKRAAIIKDDKYVQLVENIIETEGTTDSEQLSVQVNALNRKLIQVKKNQVAQQNTLAEQSMALEEHGGILNGMVPYIKKIDVKMDQSLTTAEVLHKEQISAFETGMRQQSVKLDASKNVLDVHTGHNKEHQQKLQEQMLIAQRHQEEMLLFKQQLDELKLLRAEDEKLKREQAVRQEQLEKQHAEEIKSFNKELKQQRVLREMEAAKQEKMNKQQRKELKEAHQLQLTELQKQIQQQQFLRGIEEKKIQEEKEKRELLAEKQMQDMAILQSQMEQLRIMKEAQDKKREIELKMRRQQEKKMKDVEKEIMRIKQAKKRDRKSKDGKDTELTQQRNKRMEELQRQLLTMKKEQEDKERDDAKTKEVEEIKEIQHKSKVQELKEQMSRMIREQEKQQNESQSLNRRAEKDRIQHRIQMEKMKQSMTKLEVTISENDAIQTDDDGEEWSEKFDFEDHELDAALVSFKSSAHLPKVDENDDDGNKDKDKGDKDDDDKDYKLVVDDILKGNDDQHAD